MIAAHQSDNKARQIIDQLLSHGLERSREYPIEFAFFGDRAALGELRDYLVKTGYKEDVGQSDEMLVVVGNTVLDYGTIGEAIATMKTLVDKFGVGFDGWSCAVNA